MSPCSWPYQLIVPLEQGDGQQSDVGVLENAAPNAEGMGGSAPAASQQAAADGGDGAAAFGDEEGGRRVRRRTRAAAAAEASAEAGQQPLGSPLPAWRGQPRTQR